MLLISSDYDGTYDNSLFNIRVNNHRLSDFTKEGNIFLLNTGRGFDGIKRKSDYYQIPYTYLAVGDGTYLYDMDDNLVYSNELDSDMIDKFLFFAQNNKLSHVEFLYEDKYSETFDENRSVGSVAITIDKRMFTRELRDAFTDLKRNHPTYEFTLYSSAGETFLCVKPLGITKKTPIEYLRRIHKVRKEDVFTIGDELNDIEMIESYNGFQIGENPSIKNAALGRYKAVYEFVEDVSKQKVKRR